MKVAVITANIGGIDEVIKPVAQTMPFDYFCYTEENLPFPLSSLDNRMKSKFIKMQHYKFLPGYDVYIWIDGRVEVTSPLFVEDMVNKLQGFDIVVTKHPQRKTVKEEYEFIFKLMDEGNEYLLSRYDSKALEVEREIVDGELPLYACGIFAWKFKHSENYKTSYECFDEWWKLTLTYSPFDQCLFSWEFLCLGINTTDYTHCKVNKHK